MGFHVSWIARSGRSTLELLNLSRRHQTGERHDFLDLGWYLLELPKIAPSSWVVLIAEGSENYSDLDAQQAQSLSKDGHETLYFWCSDGVMATDLVCFKNGTESWSIRYDGRDRSREPTMNGDVPQVVHEILGDLRTQQQAGGGVDYIYDLTADLGHRLLGFRHDMDFKIHGVGQFQVLRESTKERRMRQPVRLSAFQRLIGRLRVWLS